MQAGAFARGEGHPGSGHSPENVDMLLNRFELRFRSLRGSDELHEALQRWRSEHPALASYEGIEDILKLFRDKGAAYEDKNPVTIALCQLVQDEDELAMVVLVELYAPSLRNSVGRKVGKSPLTVDELHTESVDAFLAAARAVTPETDKVSGRLKGRVGDHLGDEVKAANRAQNRQYPIAPERLERAVDARAGSHQSAEDEMLQAVAPRELLEEAVRAGVITAFEAGMIEDTRPGGLSLKELAERLDRPFGHVKQQRWRAEQVLKAWLAGKKPPPRRNVRRGV